LVDGAATGLAEGQEVAVAVRPEKMVLHREPPTGWGNLLSGEVSDLSYLGDWSVVRVRLDTGATVRVSRQNATRSVEAPIARRERVYVSFRPDAAVVLVP
jgi:putrescine transport system ATP-binding protein